MLAADRQLAKIDKLVSDYEETPLDVLLETESRRCEVCQKTCVRVVASRSGKTFLVDPETSTTLTPRFTLKPELCELVATKVDAFDAKRGVEGYPRHKNVCRGAA